MTVLEASDFGAFFEAVHGVAPFPWQARLLEGVAASGDWPRLLDLPTGAGKTAAIDVALFHLALDAQKPAGERRAPRRIVMVVDRRTVVDQAFERARGVHQKLRDAEGGLLREVADRLRGLSGAGRGEAPFSLAQLRGGMPRDDAWAKRPDQAVVAVSTVDQVGSRLLFRGYGVGEGMRSVHAGLFGNDTLLLLDEVHLSRPFKETLVSVERYRGWAQVLLPDRWQFVQMSATPGEESGTEAPFWLDERDRGNATLARRLAASKPVEAGEPVKGGGGEAGKREAFARECALRAVGLAGPGRAVGVVVNRVATARDVFEVVKKEARARFKEGAEVFLVTGRMRPLDRDALYRRVEPLVRAGRARDAASAPVIVVSTQCIEAGADFDFDALVTECASLDALRQRFGRLNRLGEGEGARGVVLVRGDSIGKDAWDPIYGGALARTWEWLGKGARDFGIDAMQSALPQGEALSACLSPGVSAPVMLPSHLDAWAQTRPSPVPDPDVSLWLHGIVQEPSAEVHVVWRADLSERVLRSALRGGKALDAVLSRVEVCPPVGLEAMSVPLYAARAWLRGEEAADVADVEGDPRSKKERERDGEGRSGEARGGRPALLWKGEGSLVVEADDKELCAGCTLVVPGSYGGIGASGLDDAANGTWDPSRREPVRDLGDEARWRQTGKAVLRLCAGVVREELVREPAAAEDVEDPNVADEEAVKEGLSAMSAAGVNEWWVEPVKGLLRRKKGRSIVRIEEARFFDEAGRELVEPGYLAVVSRAHEGSGRDVPGSGVTTEEDNGSLLGVEVTLKEHLAGVAGWAKGFAERCGLPERVVRSIEAAAAWHDAGKVDERFQKLLCGGVDAGAGVGEPLAKSRIVLEDRAARERAFLRSGYPRGTRHEVSSVALLRDNVAVLGDVDVELVLHLIASHHGWCRPFAPVAEGGGRVDLVFKTGEIIARAGSDHGLERWDSGIADRFWRSTERYGWFGLAWLEAILRLADHRRSEEEQRGKVGQEAKEGR